MVCTPYFTITVGCHARRAEVARADPLHRQEEESLRFMRSVATQEGGITVFYILFVRQEEGPLSLTRHWQRLRGPPPPLAEGGIIVFHDVFCYAGGGVIMFHEVSRYSGGGDPYV